jgi:hypothetical protein
VVHSFRYAVKEEEVSENSPRLISPAPHLLLGRGSFQQVSHDTRVQVACFGTSCFELPWATLTVQRTLGYPLVVISGVPASIPTSVILPGASCIEGGVVLLTRTTTGHALVPQLLRRRKWSRPLFVAWPCHSRSTSPQPPKCVSSFRKLSAQSSR